MDRNDEAPVDKTEASQNGVTGFGGQQVAVTTLTSLTGMRRYRHAV